MSQHTQPAVVGENGAPSMESTGGAPSKGGFDSAQNSSGAASKLIVPFSGAVGFPGVEMFNRDILMATIVWTSTQPAGTVLWSSVINPTTQNPIISYFCRPYNCWTGGFIYSITFVGTGYNGGKAMLVKIPPNVDTSGWTAQDFTFFSPTIYDVKEANTVAHTGYDQKNVIFHYTNASITDTDGNGGTLYLVVLAPLVNANGTACQVNTIIFNRADPSSFRVTQLLPITYAEDNVADIQSAQLLFPPSLTEPYFGLNVTNAYVNVAAPQLTSGQYGQVDASGANTGNGVYVPLPQLIGVNSASELVDVNGNDVARPVTVTSHSGNITNYWNSTCTLFTPGSVTFSGNNALVPNNGQLDLAEFSSTWGVSLGSNPSVLIFDITSSNSVTLNEDAVENVLEQNESVVTFGTAVNTCISSSNNFSSQAFSSVLCVEQINILQQGVLKNLISPGQAILFEVSQKSTGLPVGYIKFNYPGYFTALPRTSQLIVQYNQYSFRPLQIMPMSTAIPANPAVVLNGQVAQLTAMMS